MVSCKAMKQKTVGKSAYDVQSGKTGFSLQTMWVCKVASPVLTHGCCNMIAATAAKTVNVKFSSHTYTYNTWPEVL